MKTAILSSLLMLFTSTTFAMNDCQTQSMNILRKHDPQAYSIFARLTAGEQNRFLRGLTCEVTQTFELSFAVKNMVQNLQTFQFISGEIRGSLALPPKTLRPDALLNVLDVNDPLVKYYLTGDSKVKGDPNVMFEALNAHTHELRTATKLHSLLPGAGAIAFRDRLATVMNMVKNYIERARQTDAYTFGLLMKPTSAETIRKLWSQAEAVLKDSCAPSKQGLGINDRAILDQVYSSNGREGLVMLLDYTPEISSQCRNAAR